MYRTAYQMRSGRRDLLRSRWLHITARTIGSVILVLAASLLVMETIDAASRGFNPPPGVGDPALPYTLLGRSMLAVALGVQVLGLAAAWRWERLGGLVAIGGYLLKQATLAVDGGAPFLVLWFDVWLWPALAGLLYLVCWWRNHHGGGRLLRDIRIPPDHIYPR